MSLKDDGVKLRVVELANNGYNKQEISNILGIPRKTISDFLNQKSHKDFWEEQEDCSPYSDHQGPKILTLDIETAPILANVWRCFKENISLDQIKQDWYIISYAAKWFHEDEVFYEDKRDSWQDEDDAFLLESLWALLDEADIIVTQNGKKFDEKKINARFILNGFQPPSSYRHIDTLQIAKRHFGFTSNKLAYMTEKLCKKYKKTGHEQFSGFILWKECLAGNMEAWIELQDYNILDVLSLEELYVIMRPWFKSHPNMSLYYDSYETRCQCGSTDFEESGFAYTNLSKFLKFRCTNCGAEVRDRVNLVPKEKRQNIKGNVL